MFEHCVNKQLVSRKCMVVSVHWPLSRARHVTPRVHASYPLYLHHSYTIYLQLTQHVLTQRTSVHNHTTVTCSN